MKLFLRNELAIKQIHVTNEPKDCSDMSSQITKSDISVDKKKNLLSLNFFQILFLKIWNFSLNYGIHTKKTSQIINA